MSSEPALRLALSADGVSVWSARIFGPGEPARARDFLSRAFAVEEVRNVELRRASSFGRVRYASTEKPADIWKKLSRALNDAPRTDERLQRDEGLLDASFLHLDGEPSAPVHVTRVGGVLSTWRVRHQDDRSIGLWHPVLRNRRDLVFRLEEELAALAGVDDFRASALSARVSIRFDASATSAERLVRQLEKAWPRVLDGLDGPPSRKRLTAATGLLGLAYTGQYVVPALRPFAVAGVTLYSLPNVVNAAKDASRGKIGLPALYSTGVGLMLLTGFPFTASVMAVFMQLWPQLAHRKLVKTQRRLFAGQRRRPHRARLARADGTELDVHADAVRRGDLVVVRGGEVLVVDGVVEDGVASVVDDAFFGARHVEDKTPGAALSAGSLVTDGTIRVRVERAGAETAAAYVDSLLPHATFADLPASAEAERIANRNAKPALALAALSFFLTRILQPSQAVIRPDYATAPRLSAQLSTLEAVARAWQLGVLSRNPGALSRVSDAEVFLIDDTAGAERRALQVDVVRAANGVRPEVVAGYVLASRRHSLDARSRALSAFASRSTTAEPGARGIERRAGVTRYLDRAGDAIEIASAEYLRASRIQVPARLELDVAHAGTRPEASLRPLWALREGKVIGAVGFAQNGEVVGRELVASLREQSPRARFVYVSRRERAAARQIARALGTDSFHSGLAPHGKLALASGFDQPTLWLGDGSELESRALIEASTVSVSVAPLARAREDAADFQLPFSDLFGLTELIDVARDYERQLAADYRLVYGANLSGVAGAFLASFNALQSGLLSNVGTALVYLRHAFTLDRLAAAADERRARLEVASQNAVPAG